jgi:hypothetical protein
MNELIEDYQRKINTINKLLKDSSNSEETINRLKIKVGCYRSFLTDLKRALNIDLVSHCNTCGKELTNIGGSQMYCNTCGTTKIGCC